MNKLPVVSPTSRRAGALLMGVLFAGLCGFAAAQAEAAQPEADDPLIGLRGEWIRAGAGFACRVAVPEKLRPAAIEAVLSRACQHMGPFVIGDDVKAVMKVLGKPSRKLPQPKGQTAWVYFLEKEGSYPYLIVTVVRDKVAALQLTGPSAAKGYSFSHIDLGMPSATLLQAFGQPGHLGPSEEKGTELWTYGPWPFSFEVRDDHVSSIRIREP